jgi:hypothetical protein
LRLAAEVGVEDASVEFLAIYSSISVLVPEEESSRYSERLVLLEEQVMVDRVILIVDLVRFELEVRKPSITG